MGEYTSVEEQVEFAVSQIDPGRRIDLSMRDLMYVYATVGELIRFFHQPLHYQSLKDVETFIGDKDKGAFHLLWTIYYDKLRDVWPDDIQRGFDDGLFDNPHSPYYHEPKSEAGVGSGYEFDSHLPGLSGGLPHSRQHMTAPNSADPVVLSSARLLHL